MTEPSLPVHVPRPAGPTGPGDLRRFLQLWYAPTAFFQALMQRRPVVIIAFSIVVSGIGYAVERIQRRLARDSAGIDDWAGFWLTGVLVGACVSGPIGYYTWGWWLRVRLRWAGCPDAEVRLSRDVAAVPRIVQGIPLVIFTMWQTVAYPTPAAAMIAGDLGFVVVLGFALWSVVVGYQAVRVCFPVARGGAVWWFLVLPAVAYTFMVAVTAAQMLARLGR